MAVPASTLVNCLKPDVTFDICEKVTIYRIKLMLSSDLIYTILMSIWIAFVIIKLIISSWKYSRLESRSHMLCFVANLTGFIIALPLIILNLHIYINHTDNYADMKLPYYLDFVAKVLPSLVYLATKTNCDCFNCFNRLAP